MPRILSISYDPNLLNIRQMLLEASGFSVTSAEGYEQALAKCKVGDYDLVIMGHSIPYTDKEALIQQAMETCHAPILSLHTEGEDPPPGTSEEVDPQRPELLIEAVKRLTQR